jgi:hypothetical protein
MVVAGAVQTVVDVAAALVVTFAVAGAVGVWMTARAARRRWRRWRSAMTLARQVRQAPAALAAVAALPVTDVDWWLGQRDRHRMWRAVSSAERAVAAAKQADAPLGDLVVLTRQLRSTARSTDALVRAGGRDSRRQVDDVVAAAHDIRAVTAESLLLVARPETSWLADAVRTEVAALRHGLAAIQR